MITAEQYWGMFEQYRKFADLDDSAMSVDDFESKWLSSKTSPIIAATKAAPLADAKPVSRAFFVECMVDYVQESVRTTRLIRDLLSKKLKSN